MKKFILPLLLSLSMSFFMLLNSYAESGLYSPNIDLLDTSKTIELDLVTISSYKALKGVGYLSTKKDGIIYAGKKTELIIVDSLNANKAINNTRQILGRIPGLYIVETESGGFAANGIATRGLKGNQSYEMNTRQNGYNISADIYGYNEAYVLPPMEAIQSIELVRGASSIQFGSQFGGMVNYVLRDAPKNKDFEFNTSQTIGSYGMFNSFNSMGGNKGKWSYYGFLQYRNMEGYRENSRQWQLSGYGKVKYQANPKLRLGLEYTFLRNQVQMPGGLTDSSFQANPRASTRSRNWLKTPWNVLTASLNYLPDDRSSLSVQWSYLFSNRSLVWRNGAGGPQSIDEIDPLTNEYMPREVGKQNMNNTNAEIRYAKDYLLFKQTSTLSAGIRLAQSWLNSQRKGNGTTGSDFDFSITGDWGSEVDYSTSNLAPFIENMFQVNKHLRIIPGIRVEYLKNTAKGYKLDSEQNRLETDEIKSRVFPLLALGLEYELTSLTNLYANYSEAYRPISYGQLSAFGSTAKIDPELDDSNGFNMDIGYRGNVKNYFNFDVSAFFLKYNDRVGLVMMTDPDTGEAYSLRTNVSDSRHRGIEAYLEFDLLKYISSDAPNGLSIFNSFSYIDAQYTQGEYKGNRVEGAANMINRSGLTWNTSNLSSTLQLSYVGDAFGDASNAYSSSNPAAGYIPSYSVIDWSSSYKINNYLLKFGINNLANKSYFTYRANEYPGPGIIPAIGRSYYLGFSATF